MAVEAFTPDVPARKRPIDEHGKLRFLYSKTTAAVAGDIGSTVKIGTLPPGAVRVLPGLSQHAHSAWGAARTVSYGFAAYRYKQDQAAAGDGIQAAQTNVLASALDYSASLTAGVLNALLLKWDLYSVAGVDVVATVAGGTFPLAGTLEATIAYLYE